MLWAFLQSFSFIPIMASEEMIFEYLSLLIAMAVAMATNQIQQFGQNSYAS